jgi:hypothetical protein
MFALGALVSVVLPYEYSEWRGHDPRRTVMMALRFDVADESRASRLGVRFDPKECHRDQCAILRLAFYNPGEAAVRDVQVLCGFSGAIIWVSTLPVVSFLERDGTPMTHPGDRLLYRNNVTFSVNAVPPRSYVVPTFVIRRESKEGLEASCKGLKGDFEFEKVDWADLPKWVLKDIAPQE